MLHIPGHVSQQRVRVGGHHYKRLLDKTGEDERSSHPGRWPPRSKLLWSLAPEWQTVQQQHWPSTIAKEVTVSSLVNKHWWVSTLRTGTIHHILSHLQRQRNIHKVITEEFMPQNKHAAVPCQSRHGVQPQQWPMRLCAALVSSLVNRALQRSLFLIQASGSTPRPWLLGNILSFSSFNSVAFSDDR